MYSEPISENELMALRVYFGWPIPEKYIEFLKFSSGAMVGAYPIYGTNPIELMDKRRNTIISATDDFRHDDWNFGTGCMVMSENHAGDPILLYKNGCIAMLSHDGFEKKNWKNFTNFLSWCLGTTL